MNWRNFKTDPPYDAYYAYKKGEETDFVYAWFIYKNVHPDKPKRHYLSFQACKFSNGVFEPYESAMKTSPYLWDRIEVIAWASDKDVEELIFDTFGTASGNYE